MKLGPEAFREIISIIQKGMLGEIDVSQELRSLELQEGKDGLLTVEVIEEPTEEQVAEE